MSLVNIGVLGVGRIGHMHATIIARDIPGARLASVYDIATDHAANVAAELDTTAARSPEEMFQDPSVDAVAICSSTDTHIDLLVAAAEAGKAVFIEKPLSLDLADVDRGVAAVQNAGIVAQVGFNRRFDPSHRQVHEAVSEGAIGDVHLVRITSRDPAPPPIEYIKVSGGIFNDMTIHDFDMARYVTGSDVVSVYATGAVRVDPAIGEAGDMDTAVVVLTHQNGAITTIDNSRQAVYGYDQRVEVFGSGGMVGSENPTTTTTIRRDASGSAGSPVPYFFLERYTQSYRAEWLDFVQAVNGVKESPVTVLDGRAPLVIGLAAKKSAQEGRPVAISEVDPAR